MRERERKRNGKDSDKFLLVLLETPDDERKVLILERMTKPMEYFERNFLAWKIRFK